MSRTVSIQVAANKPDDLEAKLRALLSKGPMTLDEAAAGIGTEGPRAATLVSELINDGQLLLVVVAQPWGVDYMLQLLE